MVGYNPKKSKRYCDLQCFNCEGFGLKECLMNTEGNHMRLLRIICMAERRLLSEFKARPDSYWARFNLLTPKILETDNFPKYHGEIEH